MGVTVDHGSFLPSALLEAAPTGDLLCVATSATSFSVCWPLSSTRYVAVEFRQTSYALANGFRAIRGAQFAIRAGSEPARTDATISAGWTNSVRAECYDGRFYRATTPGETIEWVSPAATTVGARGPKLSNGGVSKVSIDGSATAATSLPTAQQLVDAGTLASTVLVANGGTLNPTDRVWNHYQSSTDWDAFQVFATGLSDTAHTIVVTATGYKQAASADVRSYLSGFFFEDAAASEVAFTGMITNPASGSVWERAIFSGEWMGCAHGNEVLDALTVTVDGDPFSLTAGTFATGSEVVVSATSALRNSSVGSGLTDVADVVTTWTCTPARMLVEQSIEWLSALPITTAYLAMLPVDDGWDRCSLRRDGSAIYDVSADDDTEYGKIQSSIGWFYQSSGAEPLVLAMELFDVANTVNGWATSNSDMFVWDRTDGLNKLYASRVAGQTVTPTIGDVWSGTSAYVFGEVADPSDLVGVSATTVSSVRATRRRRAMPAGRRVVVTGVAR